MVDFPPSSADKKRVTIYIGGYHIATEPTVVKTVLGSCVSVCLYERERKIGGMNHFMLPNVKDINDYNNTRYGIFAMEMILNEIIKLGGKKRNLRAKVFGGGHVLETVSSNILQVPEKNIAFARQFLKNEQIPIDKEDVGGVLPRKLFFFAIENRVLLKKIERSSKEFSLEKEIKYERDLEQKQKGTTDLTIF